jgi:hypothetical protein
MSIQMRESVVAELAFSDDTQKSDLLNPDLTNTNLIAALAQAVFPAPHGQGHRLLITSVRTDHSDDSALGPHCHARGFAVDLWPQDDVDLHAVAQDFCTNNPWVIKLGLGGISQSLALNAGDTVVFFDNSTNHLHVEVYG